MVKLRKDKAGSSSPQQALAPVVPGGFIPVPGTPAAQKSKLELVDNVKQFARFMRSVIELTDFVGDVDKLERQANEAETRAAAKREEEAKVDADLAKKRAAVELAEQDKAAVEKQAQDILVRAKADATRIVAEAKEKARGLEVDAKGEAEEAQQDAKAIRQKARADADAIIAAAEEEAAKVDAETDTSRQALANINQQYDEKAAELDGLQTQIDGLKAQISKILGA